jgi:ketosteroid isomerase-like protein
MKPSAPATHAALIERFYRAFAARDAEGMAACYHDEAVFSDPVFGELDTASVRDMWRMLIERGRDLEIRFDDIVATEERGSASWEARYTFSAGGRKVVNRIRAKFVFRDGLIAEHRDHFDFPAWARQALGWKGLLFGRLPALRRAVGAQARLGLDRWRARPR